jgi:hypothetical protein
MQAMIFCNEPFKYQLLWVFRLFETKVQESNLQLITEWRDSEIILGDSDIKFN